MWARTTTETISTEEASRRPFGPLTCVDEAGEPLLFTRAQNALATSAAPATEWARPGESPRTSRLQKTR